MFGIDSGELLIIALVALVVIGPKDLPRAMRAIGKFVGQARGMARHFRSGVDAMMREAELEEMNKKWAADNERIMREHPSPRPGEEWAPPVAEEAAPPRSRGRRVPSGPKAPPARGKASKPRARRPAPSPAPPPDEPA